MTHGYASLKSISKDDFDRTSKQLQSAGSEAKSDTHDLRNIEELLCLRPGLLSNQKLFVSRAVCKCGASLTFFDCIQSAIKDYRHSKSLIVHALLGYKYVVQPSKPVKCRNCGESHLLSYRNPQYITTDPVRLKEVSVLR
jgi:hypothetical protein